MGVEFQCSPTPVLTPFQEQFRHFKDGPTRKWVWSSPTGCDKYLMGINCLCTAYLSLTFTFFLQVHYKNIIRLISQKKNHFYLITTHTKRSGQCLTGLTTKAGPALIKA